MDIVRNHLSILREQFRYDGQWYAFNGFCWRELKYPLDAISEVISDMVRKRIILTQVDATLFETDIEKDPKHLICFFNGVYDFKLRQFRKTLSKDFCTLCTNYAYEPTYDKDLWFYLHQVFPDTEDYIEFIRVMDDLFKGNHKVIYATDGNIPAKGGSLIPGTTNGINTLFNIIHSMYGSYRCNQPVSRLTCKNVLLDLQYHYKQKYIAFDTKYASEGLEIYRQSKEFTSILTQIKIRTEYGDNILKELNKDGYVTELKLKSLFHIILTLKNKYNYQYKDLTNQLPSFALTLMTKLISLQDAPIRYLYFYHNPIFVFDITNYILNYYFDIMYID